VKRRRHAVQLIEEDLTLPHPIAKGANSYKPKPLSADDIKKAKGSSTKAATAPILSPPLSTTKQVEIGKRQREEGKEANLGGEAMEVIHEEEAPQPSKKRKRVSWAPEDKLTTVKTFEKYLPSLVHTFLKNHIHSLRVGAFSIDGEHFTTVWIFPSADATGKAARTTNGRAAKETRGRGMEGKLREYDPSRYSNNKDRAVSCSSHHFLIC